MKMKCDVCGLECSGTKDELLESGWSMAIITKPIKKKMIRCKEHSKTLGKDITKLLLDKKEAKS